MANERLVPPQCRSSRQMRTGSFSAASSMRDCTSCRSQNRNSDEAWTSLSARRSARGGSPSNSASKRAPSSIARPGSAAPRPTRNESSCAMDTHSSSSLVLPRPALPSTTTTHPVPARTWLSLRRMTASSRSRPRRGGRGEASIFRTVHQGLTGPLTSRVGGRAAPIHCKIASVLGDRASTRDTISVENGRREAGLGIRGDR